MTIVLYKHYGGFSIPEPVAAKRGIHIYDDIPRDDLDLVEYVRTHDTDLTLVTIPDEATDWEIDEYDGYERVTYVRDGKLWHA